MKHVGLAHSAVVCPQRPSDARAFSVFRIISQPPPPPMSPSAEVLDRRAHRLAPAAKKVGRPLSPHPHVLTPRSPRCRSPQNPASTMAAQRPTRGQRAAQSRSATTRPRFPCKASDTRQRARPTDGRDPPLRCLPARCRRGW